VNKLFYKLAPLLKIIPTRIVIKITGQKVIFPFYHAISDEEIIHIKHLYKVRNSKAFEKDLDFMLGNFTPIDYNTLIYNITNGQSFKENSFLLTFDDGLREFHDIVAPVLLRKGVPAICFLNSDFIDNREMFFRYKASVLVEKVNSSKATTLKKIEKWFLNKEIYHYNIAQFILSINYKERNYLDELAAILDVDFKDYLKKHSPYLSAAQINTLINQGFAFGAHSIDHPKYADLDICQQIFQTNQSLKEITSSFNLHYKLFSFPFTDTGIAGQFFDEVFNPGHPLADITFGCAGLKKDVYKRNIQRIPVEIDNFPAEDIISGEYFYYMFKALLNKNTLRRA
jgi:peptidoglycan/xylan/chitin deacetylase (PgdA/CDA1 family)